jgi:hypothetical protein
MANDKRFVVKNGLQAQNINFTDSADTNSITISMLDSDTLSFSGNSGQLFSITDSLTGTIFAVNDISGIPSIEVDDDGTIRLAESAGNVLIGTDTDDDTNKLQVAGSVAATGDITAFFSDERLKDRYDNISNPVDKVKSLNGFYYEPNEIAQSLGYEKKMYIGLSAQEVQAILPEVIKPAPVDNKYLTVDYAKLVPLLVEAIKEQQEHIERLESKIDLLGK